MTDESCKDRRLVPKPYSSFGNGSVNCVGIGMKYSIALALLLLLTAVQAQHKIYKSVDENGNVVFSDQPPSKDAVPIVLQESNVVKIVKAQPAPMDDPNQQATAPTEIAILSPESEATFWGTGNDLSVQLEITPAMTPGMKIQLYIDDEHVATISTSATRLQQIDRGTHTFRAELISRNGEIIATTESRTFFMKQWSQKFNNN